MTPQIYRNVLFGAAVLAGFALFFQGDIRRYLVRNIDLFSEVTRVNAVGATFALTDVKWVKFFGMWEVHSNIVVEKLPRGTESIAYVTAMNGICGALLTNMVGAPDAVGSRSDVFRVALNFWQVKKGAIIKEKVFDVPFPLPIEDGACAKALPSSEWVMTYPYPLEGWRLAAFGGELSGAYASSDHTAHFNWIGDGNMPSDEFAFDEACTAAVGDAPLYRPGAIEEGKTLVVIAGLGSGSLEAWETVGDSVQYIIAEGNCVRIGEGAKS